jgi:uncharacterized protein (DUF488 family)
MKTLAETDSLRHISPPMMATLFTMGYQMRSLGEFLDLLKGARIDVLVDVRETPWSHKPGFSKGLLSMALGNAGIDYVHARFAGNPKRLRSTAVDHADCLRRYREYLGASSRILVDFEQLLQPLLSSGLKACLTCYERHPEDCHRGILAEYWAKGPGRVVRHLWPDGCDRLIRENQIGRAACA